MDLTELKRTINLCKESIHSATEDLTKLTGRNFDKPLDSQRPFHNAPISADNQRFTTKRRNSYENDNPSEVKRTRVDRDAPALNSVVKMTRGRTRNDAIQDLQTKENPKEKERCKRLFGHLMCTLNSIKKESELSTNDPQQLTRMKIEKKVEEDHKLISETIKREQNELLRAKKDRQNDLKILNQRYRAAEAFDRWRIEKEKMKGYIRTGKTPFIFYRPKVINEENQLRLDQTAREIDLLIETRKKKLESDIERAVKRHLEVSGAKHDNGMDLDNVKINERLLVSTVSVVKNNNNNRERSKSVADSFASEDYDDMIEEIEITMHDEPVAVHDDEQRSIVVMETNEENNDVSMGEEQMLVNVEIIVEANEGDVRIKKEEDIIMEEEQRIKMEEEQRLKMEEEQRIKMEEEQRIKMEEEQKIEVKEIVEEKERIVKDESKVDSEGVDIDMEKAQISEVPETSQD